MTMEPTLISMELEKSDAEAMYGADMSEQPKYPYGLQLSLDEGLLAKLGLRELPAVGTDMKLVAEVEICSVSSYEAKDGSPDQRVCLQIEAMSLTPMTDDPSDQVAKPNPAQTLYGNNKG